MSDIGEANAATAEPVSEAGIDDLNRRRLENQQQREMLKRIERWVLALKIDWMRFHKRHSRKVDVPCNGKSTAAERVLAGMGLEKKAIEICLLYFAHVGGGCDCEIALNVDMTDPRSPADFACHDCGNDFDEYYLVHDHVWNASGLSKDGGMLCVGCLEKRLGRRLCRDDFTECEINKPRENQSLRLQDRISDGAQS